MLTAVLLAGGVSLPAEAQERGRGRGRGAQDAPGVRRGAVPPGRDGVAPQARGSAGRPWRPQDRRGGPYQEPAFARGYADGYTRGMDDGAGQERYDPVGHRDYRNGDQGYGRDYGSRDSYRNNYRAGFRQGYDDGYRENGRGRR